MKEKIIDIDAEISLFDAVKKVLPGSSNKKIKSYFKYRMVEVNGEIVTNMNSIVKKGNVVKIFFSKRTIEKFDLSIIYEDDDLIAINKPAGLLSISNSKEKEITAYRMVSDYVKTNHKKAKIFVVHRLDQGTSGVLMFAKNEKIKDVLQRSWNDIVKKREYYAVVEGKMDRSGTIESYLAMNHFQKVYSTTNKNGWYARTHYERVAHKNGYSLLKVDIDTGRRNQIRVHMSEAGHPVTGDKKYGAKKNPINRLALHASVLEFIDPRNGKLLSLKTSVPEEIRQLTY